MKQVFQLDAYYSQVLEHNTTLLHLVLRGIVNAYTDAELLLVGQALKSNHTLQTLNIVQIAEPLSDDGACLSYYPVRLCAGEG